MWEWLSVVNKRGAEGYRGRLAAVQSRMPYRCLRLAQEMALCLKLKRLIFLSTPGGKCALLKLPARTYKVVRLLTLAMVNETIHYTFTGCCSDLLECRIVLFLCSCELRGRCAHAHSPEAPKKLDILREFDHKEIKELHSFDLQSGWRPSSAGMMALFQSHPGLREMNEWITDITVFNTNHWITEDRDLKHSASLSMRDDGAKAKKLVKKENNVF